MTVSDTSIVNMALGRIGHAPIDDLAENSPEAIAANAIFETCRNYVEADFPWDFCTEIQTLAETTNDRENDWAYAYERPTCQRFRRVLPYQGKPDPRYPIPYLIRGQKLYCDTQYARGEFLVIVEDVTLFSPAFINALAFYLAAELCMPLGKDNALTQRMVDAYETSKDKARQADASETPTNQNEMRPDASWIAARDA